MALPSTLLDRATTAASRARRTTLADLQRLFGAVAGADGDLLATHVSDAGDADIAARLAGVLDDSRDGERRLADLMRTSAPAAAITVLRALLGRQDRTHALSLAKTAPVCVGAGFDVRDAGDEKLSLHLQGASGLRPGMVAILVDLQHALTVWRICEIERIDEDVITLLRMAEHRVPAMTRQVEPPCLVTVFAEPIAAFLDRIPVEEGQALLKDAEFAHADRKRNPTWSRHAAPARAKPDFRFGEAARLSSKEKIPAVAALHQMIPARRPGAYRFGARLRATAGTPAVALRLVAFPPEGEQVIDQCSMVIEPSAGWMDISRTTFTDSAHPLRFEVGVLNLDADHVVEIAAPFLETIAPVWRSSRSKGL